jgi:hypothetical protein
MTKKADELNNEEWKAKDWVTEKMGYLFLANQEITEEKTEITEDQLGLKRRK